MLYEEAYFYHNGHPKNAQKIPSVHSSGALTVMILD